MLLLKTKTDWVFKYWPKDTCFAKRKYFDTKKHLLKFISKFDWSITQGHLIKKTRYMVVSKKLTTFYYDEYCVTTKGKIKCFLDMDSKEKKHI